MLSPFSNFVRVAVERVGGPTRAARLMDVANATVHNWITNQRVPNINQARKLSGLSCVELDRLRRTK